MKLFSASCYLLLGSHVHFFRSQLHLLVAQFQLLIGK